MPLIRPATLSDAAQIAAIYAPYCDETPISFELSAPSEEEIAARISRIGARYPWLVLEDEGAIAGYAYGSQHRERAAYQWSVDVTVYVSPRFHRRGVGRALYTTLFRMLALQGFYRAHAGITLPNAGSVGLHEAMGFEPVGVYRNVGYKLGKWHDVGWYQLMLQPPIPDPAEPVAFSPLLNSPEWEEAVAAGLELYRG